MSRYVLYEKGVNISGMEYVLVEGGHQRISHRKGLMRAKISWFKDKEGDVKSGGLSFRGSCLFWQNITF